MSIYRCERCGCVENTAVSNYWQRKKDDPKLCSECDPAIGKWHGAFPQEPADGNYVDDGRGYLISVEEAEMRKWQERMVEDAKGFAHIGLEGVIRTAFARGWNYGAAYALDPKAFSAKGQRVGPPKV